MFENIAVGVVIYNPPETVWNNISFFTKLKLRVWIIDNSVVEQKVSVSGIEFYKYNANNGGLAKALNILCEKANELNLDWLLTLDQDSIFKTEKDLLNLLEHAKNAECDTGILAPKILQTMKAGLNSYVMTSGSLLRVQAWKECGKYCEYFFIDALDTEYCFRLQNKGWKIMVVDNSMLEHKQGAMKLKCIPLVKKHFYIFEYSPERLYYIMRNHIITINHYNSRFPVGCRELKKFLRNSFIKILLYENNRYAKLKMAMRGFLDARKEIASQKKNFLLWVGKDGKSAD
jgi:rhamnosyltransferase